MPENAYDCLLPDLHDFVGDIEASFRELSAAPEGVEIQAVPRKAARTRERTRTRPSQRQDRPGNPEPRIAL